MEHYPVEIKIVSNKQDLSQKHKDLYKMTIQELIISEMLKEDSSLRKQDITTFTVTNMALKLIAEGILEVTEDGQLAVAEQKVRIDTALLREQQYERCPKCGTKSDFKDWKPLKVACSDHGPTGFHTSGICPHCKGKIIMEAHSQSGCSHHCIT